MALKDKLLLACVGFLLLAFLGALVWGFVLDYQLRNNTDTRRVRDLEVTVVSLEGTIAKGQSKLAAAIGERDEARSIAGSVRAELDEYTKRLDIGSGAIGRGEDATSRIENIISQIEARGTVGTD